MVINNFGIDVLVQMEIPELRELALDKEREPAEFWILYGLIIGQLLQSARLEPAARLWEVAKDDLGRARTLVRALPTMVRTA